MEPHVFTNQSRKPPASGASKSFFFRPDGTVSFFIVVTLKSETLSQTM